MRIDGLYQPLKVSRAVISHDDNMPRSHPADGQRHELVVNTAEDAPRRHAPARGLPSLGRRDVLLAQFDPKGSWETCLTVGVRLKSGAIPSGERFEPGGPSPHRSGAAGTGGRGG